MATSSITKNFVVNDKIQGNMFVDAIEASYNEAMNNYKTMDMHVSYLQSADELRDFMLKRKND